MIRIVADVEASTRIGRHLESEFCFLVHANGDVDVREVTTDVKVDRGIGASDQHHGNVHQTRDAGASASPIGTRFRSERDAFMSMLACLTFD